MDKKKTKDILTANGIPTPEYYSIKFQGADFKCRMSLPVVVKPSDSGSSIGVTIVRDKDLFAGAIRKAFRYSPEVIVEKYIPGKEVTVGILDDNAIGAMEVRTEKEFLSYNVKYTPGMEEFVIPPEIPQKALKQCLEYSLNAFRVLGCTGYGRIDTRVTPSGKVYILEINTLPGLTELSYLPKIAEWRNISYDALIEKILLTASLKGR
jgi:D-alanine-D-alanine ligase